MIQKGEKNSAFAKRNKAHKSVTHPSDCKHSEDQKQCLILVKLISFDDRLTR